MAAKPADPEGFLKRIPSGVRGILLHGSDTGLIAERALTAAKGFASSDADIIRISADDLAADPARLAEEATSPALFGGNRALIVRPEQHNIADLLKDIAERIGDDVLVIVTAGALKKTAPLLKLFGGGAPFAALACYPDSERGIETLVDAALRDAGLSIEEDARALLISQLGGDRLATRMELDKLLLYAAGTDRVCLDDVVAVTGDVSALALDQALDATGLGDARALDRAARRLFAAGTHPVQLAVGAVRHFTQLHAMRVARDEGTPARQVVEAARPPVFFMRRADMARQLDAWPMARIEAALETLHEAERLARRSDGLERAGVMQCLFAIATGTAPGLARARAAGY